MAIIVERDGGRSDREFVRLNHQNLSALTGATTMDARQFKGGTINVRDLEVGS